MANKLSFLLSLKNNGVRYFAAFLAVSAFVLSVAAVASNDWANSFDVTTDSHVTKFGLFNHCETLVNDADGKRFEFCCQNTQSDVCAVFGADKTCENWRQYQATRTFTIAHLILIGLAAVALAGAHGSSFASLKNLAVATSALAFISGVIGMAVFIRFKRDLTDHLNATYPGNNVDTTYESGFKLHTTAWAISLTAFLFTLLVKKPSAAAELASDAAGAI